MSDIIINYCYIKYKKKKKYWLLYQVFDAPLQAALPGLLFRLSNIFYELFPDCGALARILSSGEKCMKPATPPSARGAARKPLAPAAALRLSFFSKN